MRKIALCTADLLPVPATKNGAVEILVENLIKQNEIEKEFEFLVFSVYDKRAKKKSKEYARSKFVFYKNDGIRAKLYNIKRKLYAKIKKKDLPFLYSTYLKLKKTKKFNPDYVIVENGKLPKYRDFHSVISREKMIFHLHWRVPYRVDTDEIFGKYIAISDFVKNSFIDGTEINKSKVKVLKNCVDESIFYPLDNCGIREKYGIKENDFLCIFVGRLVENKGVIQAIKAVKSLNGQAKLLILGAGEDSFINVIRDEIGNDENVILVGQVNNDELNEFYSSSDLCLFLSIVEEGAGLVAVESMACKTPLIVTDSGGIGEYADLSVAEMVERDKLFFDDKSQKVLGDDSKFVQDVVEKILKFKNDRALLEKMKGDCLIKAREFTISNYYRNFVNIIDEFEEMDKGE